MAASIGLQPNRRLGQNFLVDGNLVRKSVEMARVTPGDTIVEVGPGLGTLTRALLSAGAVVHAIEKDRRLYDFLCENLLPLATGSFFLLCGDAMDNPMAGLPPESCGTCKVVANLPYAIATPWMEAILGLPAPPSQMVLMLQREAADRFRAEPGSRNTGAISIFLQSAYRVEAFHPVSAGCFWPRPEIDSALLALDRRKDAIFFPPPWRQHVRRVFQQRRKQLGRILQTEPAWSKNAWKVLSERHSLPGHVRPEEIASVIWQELAQCSYPHEGQEEGFHP